MGNDLETTRIESSDVGPYVGLCGQVRILVKRTKNVVLLESHGIVDDDVCTLKGFWPVSMDHEPLFLSYAIVTNRELIRKGTGPDLGGQTSIPSRSLTT